MATKVATQKMWAMIGDDIPLIIIKADSAADAKAKFADAMHNPDDANAVKVKELTLNLLDKLTSEGDFDGCEGEFSIIPGGDC